MPASSPCVSARPTCLPDARSRCLWRRLPGTVTPRHLLLDIEGTTTPIAFVTEVLFPYARAHVREYLEAHAADPGCTALIAQLRTEHQRAARTSDDAPPHWTDERASAAIDSAVRYVGWLMDRDRKSTPLKTLQGLVWEAGYVRGDLVGQVFDDVPVALAQWHQRGVPVSIFSSGSVLGQQLLFRHSSAGDLSRFIAGHFDTNVGPKASHASYVAIAAALGLSPSSVVFVSDAVRELDAARSAGMEGRLAVRPGNASPPDGHGYTVVHRLTDRALLEGRRESAS